MSSADTSHTGGQPPSALHITPASRQVTDISAGVDRLGFNKLGGGLLLAGWVAILVVVLVLVSGRRPACWRRLPRTGLPAAGGGCAGA